MRVLILAATLLAIALIFLDRVMGAECRLEWDHTPADRQRIVAEKVVKWRVFCGLDLLAEVATTSATVQLPDGPCEIAVVAINDVGLLSTPAKLKLAYVDTEDFGETLLSFRYLPGRHVEFWPGKRFYRSRIQLPP